MWNAIISGIIATAISVGSWLGVYHQQTNWDKQIQQTIKTYVEQSKSDGEILGATLPVAGSTYSLSGSGVSSSATSFSLASFTIPQNGYYIQDSDVSTTFYMTIEPGSKSRQEIVACTTVTQNSAGTATISGCSRGMSPITPYTASSTLQFAHAGGTSVILSDPPQLFEQYLTLDNDNQTVSGLVTYSVNPILTTATSSLQAINKAYADALAIAGAPDANATTKGIVEIASALETASSTGITDGDTTAHLVPSAERFTANATTTYAVPVSRADGKLDENWIATSTIDWDWARVGVATSSAGTELSVGGNAVIEATTTSSGFNATSTAFMIGGIDYEMPVATGTTNNVLAEQATGGTSVKLKWTSKDPVGFSIISPPSFHIATDTATLGVSDNTRMDTYQFTLPHDITVNKISLDIASIAQSGTVDLLVYSEDGQTNYISATTGTISSIGINTTTLSTAVILYARNYYFGILPNSTANIDFNAWKCTVSGLINAVSSEPKMCGYVGSLTAGTPPSTITPASLTNSPAGAFFRLDN